MMCCFGHCILFLGLVFVSFFFLLELFKMNRLIKLGFVIAAVALTSACTRIETGEVGVRVGFDKQVQQVSRPRSHKVMGVICSYD